MRTCSKCNREQADDEFPIQTGGRKNSRYLSRRCRTCINEGQRERYSKEAQRGYRKTRYQKDPDYKARHHLWHNYRIRLSDYEKLLNAQGGVCAICGADKSLNRIGASRFHVDHDHSTGKVRGILCINCNVGLSRFYDKPHLLRKAATYLNSEPPVILSVDLTRPYIKHEDEKNQRRWRRLDRIPD